MRYRFVLFFLIIIADSCSKEYSCENCRQTDHLPAIASLDCASGTFSSVAVFNFPYTGTCSIAYTGGNGQPFAAGDPVLSTGVTGLTAQLQGGILTAGDGMLVYTITGTPASFGTAQFAISFAGHACVLSLQVNGGPPPPPPGGSGPAVSIAAGKADCFAVMSDGTVWAWGMNTFGELGDGTTGSRSTPVWVNGLANTASVVAGSWHTLAAGKNGTVWAWGKNDYGQLGDGTHTNRPAPLQVAGLSSIIAIAAGADYSLALKNDGTVWAWGANLYGQLGNGTNTDSPRPVQVTGLSGIIAIAGGQEHCLALKNDGTVWSWGWNLNGALGDGSMVQYRSVPAQVTGLAGIIAIAANGSNHSLALKSDGTVWSWGDNFHGQLGLGTIAASRIPLQITTLTGITAIGAGENHSFALKNDGTAWAWGWNGTGQLGVNFAFNSHELTPVVLTLLPGAAALCGGDFHSIARKADGTVWTMGDNVAGQLGDGSSTIYRFTPMAVSF